MELSKIKMIELTYGEKGTRGFLTRSSFAMPRKKGGTWLPTTLGKPVVPAGPAFPKNPHP
jgi:hypothetical protein